MTRIEKVLRDSDSVRARIIRLCCPDDFPCIDKVYCSESGSALRIKDCEACWNAEYTEKDCTKKGD